MKLFNNHTGLTLIGMIYIDQCFDTKDEIKKKRLAYSLVVKQFRSNILFPISVYVCIEIAKV